MKTVFSIILAYIGYMVIYIAILKAIFKVINSDLLNNFCRKLFSKIIELCKGLYNKINVLS